MYNKVKKALIDMGYFFNEFERVDFSNGVVLGKGFRIEKSFGENVYLEITGEGELEMWGEAGDYLFTIRKKETYLMMFELGWIMRG